MLGKVGVRKSLRRLAEIDFTGFQGHANCQPFVFLVLQRPQLDKQRAFHPPIRAFNFRRFVIDYFVLLGIVPEDQAKVFGRIRSIAIAHTNYRRYAFVQVGE